MNIKYVFPLLSIFVFLFLACSSKQDKSSEKQDFLQEDTIIPVITTEEITQDFTLPNREDENDLDNDIITVNEKVERGYIITKGKYLKYVEGDAIEGDYIIRFFGSGIPSQTEIQISRYIGTQKKIIIPEKMQDSPVTRIGEDAFAGQLLTHIDIPDSVFRIHDGAFGNNLLTNIYIPNVYSIGTWAFAYNNLESITLLPNLRKIGRDAFRSNKLTSVVIPDKVTHIGDGAFGNNKIKNVIIPNSVEVIGSWAFSSNLLTSIVIPDSVTTIGEGAFQNNNLTDITIGENIKLEKSWSYDPPFGNGFDEFYETNGRAAGKYIFENDNWILTNGRKSG